MLKHQVIIRFVQACETDRAISKDIGRVNGLLNAENFYKLMGVLGVDSNPRKPKESSVTREIFDTLEENPSLFHFMSKGILISATSCIAMERNRFQLSFQDNDFAQPGVLDGGHNTFAIAKFILSKVLTQQELKKVFDWESLVSAWQENAGLLEDLFSSDEEKLSFLVPVEVIYPRNPDDEYVLGQWGESHRDITHARNNNIQLQDATKDHHQGFHDYVKHVLPPDVSEAVQWKTNDTGTIKSADVIALALIPLAKLPKNVRGEEVGDLNLQKIYNSKQYCVETFRKILESSENGFFKGQTYELTSPLVRSALDLLPKIIEAYDYVYKNFPHAYNESGGSFGRIKGVRIYDPTHEKDKKYSKKPFSTKFTGDECDYNYADGFIIPLIVGLRELIEVDVDNDVVSWRFDPVHFFADNFAKIMGMYSAIIRMADWDPQRIGKDKGSYDIAAGAIQIAAATYKP